MRETKRRYALFFWLAAGWLLGAVGVNRLFASGLINGQALYGFVTDGWIGAIEGQKAAVYRIAAVRVAQTVGSGVPCRSRMQNFGRPFLVLTGFAGSTALVVFTWCRGLEGYVVLSGIRGFPHQLFHLAAWGLLAYRYGYGLCMRRGRFWSAVISLTAGGYTGRNPPESSFLKNCCNNPNTPMKKLFLFYKISSRKNILDLTCCIFLMKHQKSRGKVEKCLIL